MRRPQTIPAMTASREIKMRFKRGLLTAELLALVFLCACGSGAGQSSNMSAGSTPVVANPPRTVYPMPPLKSTAAAAAGSVRSPYGWTLEDDKHGRLADYAGQVVVLDFYATWCPPCREEVPHLVQLQKRYGSQGVRVIGLNVGGADDADKVPGFAKEFGIPYQLGFPDEQLIDLYLSDDDRIPQTYVFDRHGTLVKRFVSYGADMPAQLEQAVQTALASKGTQTAIESAKDSSKAIVAVSH